MDGASEAHPVGGAHLLPEFLGQAAYVVLAHPWMLQTRFDIVDNLPTSLSVSQEVAWPPPLTDSLLMAHIDDAITHLATR